MFKIDNKSSEMPRLLKEFLTRPRTYHVPQGQEYRQGSQSKPTIFFYEFSNVFVTPKMFYDIYSFIEYCTTKKIKVLPYMRDIMEKCSVCRAAQREEDGTLIIRSDWVDLRDAIRDNLEF